MYYFSVRPVSGSGASDATVWLRVTEPECALTTGIAWNQTWYLSQAVRVFHRHVIAHYATMAMG